MDSKPNNHNQSDLPAIWLERFLDKIRDVLYRYDFYPTRGFTYVSPSIKDVTGYTPQEHYDDPEIGLQLVAPEDRQKFSDYLFLKKYNEGSLVLKWIRKDGTQIWTEHRNSYIYDENDNIIAVEGIARDITERIKAEISLKDSKEKLKAVLENTSDIIISVAENYTLLTINTHGTKSFIKHLGICPQVGDNLLSLLPEPIRSNWKENYDKTFAGESFTFEETHASIGSNDLYFEVTMNPIREGSTIVGAIIFIRDITDKKRMEREKDEMQKQLFHTSKLASIGELSAGVGHEINNPLAIIRATLERIKNINSINDLDRRVSVMERACIRIQNIVSGLRSFARNDQDTIDYININDLIEESIPFIETIYQKESIIIEKDLSSSLPISKGNKGQLQQVLMNLFGNARDALQTKIGGQILIKTDIVDGLVLLTITDNGIGIHKNNLENIFNSFYTTKEVGKGTGLGLSISNAIIKSMNGSIEVTSKFGSGSSFIIKLPISSEEIIHKPQKSPELTPLTGNALIVDDEEDIREVLASCLTHLGLTSNQACNGIEALEMLSNNSYDYILTDLKMPKMSGYDLIKVLRNQGRQEKIIIVSGGVTLSHEDMLAQSADATIMKPFTIKMLHSTLYELSH